MAHTGIVRLALRDLRVRGDQILHGSVNDAYQTMTNLGYARGKVETNFDPQVGGTHLCAQRAASSNVLCTKEVPLWSPFKDHTGMPPCIRTCFEVCYGAPVTASLHRYVPLHDQA